MNQLHRLGFVIFGRYVRARKDNYSKIRAAIRQAHTGVPWDAYVSGAYLLAVITGLLSALSAYLMRPLWSTVYARLSLKIGLSHTIFSGYGEQIFITTVIFLLTLVTGAVTYYGVTTYPRLVAEIRKSVIDATLPHAVAYMHALSEGGIGLAKILKSLSQHTDVYGECAEEFAYIVMKVEAGGEDLVTALKNAAIETRSDKFGDFLENLVNIVETGGSLEAFLGRMVDHYQKTAAADQRLHLETLGMLAETYITAFVAGPLFLITILIVMGIMGPGNSLTLKLVVYAVIPLSAIAFSILLSVITLESDARLVKTYSAYKKLMHYDDVKTAPPRENEERRVRRMLRSLRWTSIIQARKKPLKIFFSNPAKTFYLTIPAVTIYAASTLHQQKPTLDTLDDLIIISTLILLTPFLFFYEMQTKRIREIESSVPEFLRRLAVTTDVGMPLAAAIKTLSELNLGILSTEVKLIHKDIVWKHDLGNALVKFEQRVRTVAISRIIRLITRASESSGDVRETLRVAANYAELSEKLRREKFTILISHLIVIYISFGVFLLVLYVFAKMFFPQMPDTSSGATLAGAGRFSMGAQVEEYTTLFMHAAVIQGFFSGIIAGQMMGTGARDGLKHSIIMVATAYALFTLFI